MADSIYTAGGKVQAQGGLYLVRQADAELARVCREHAFAYVLYSRQVGKSSLLAHVAEELEAEGARVVVVDLTRIGTQVTAEQWYFGLLVEIAEQAGVADEALEHWEGHAALGFTQRLRGFFADVLVPRAERDVLVFLDEIDTTVPLPFTDDFFAVIRELYQARDREPDLRRLTFVLAGSSSPNDLIRDPDRTPFNIGVNVGLGDFTLDEAMPLAAGLSAEREEGRRILKLILGWTGGHPYLTQALCAEVAQAPERSWTAAEVDAVVADRFLRAQGDQDKNLAYVSDMLTERAARFGPGEVLRAYRHILVGRRVPDDRQSQVLSHLKLSGIVTAEGGVLVVRNRIYAHVFGRDWVDQHLPVNWKRVARAAWAAVPAVSLPLLLFVVLLWGRADRARLQAEDNERKAEAALDEAQRARDFAQKAQQEADEARQRETKAREQAEQSLAEKDAARSDEQSAQDAKVRADEALRKKNNELNLKLVELQKKNAAFSTRIVECAKTQSDLDQCTKKLSAGSSAPQ